MEATRKLTVFAHYFTWFSSKNISGRWCHWNWTGKTPHNPDLLRDGKPDIASIRTPVLGPYDSGDRVTQEQHIKWAKESLIDAFTVDWYGPAEERIKYRDRIVDANFKNLLQTSADMDFKICICYEEKILYEDENRGSSDRTRTEIGVRHFSQIKKYIESESYYKIDGRPLIVIWGTHTITPDVWSEIFKVVREFNPIILYSY